MLSLVMSVSSVVSSILNVVLAFVILMIMVTTPQVNCSNLR